MTPDEEWKELLRLADDRNARYYVWLRHLLLVAAGALALLAGLVATGSFGTNPAAVWSLKAAWVSLGAGILLLAYVTRGEAWTASERLRRVIQLLDNTPPSGRDNNGRGVVQLPWRYKAATGAGCAALCAAAVLALIVHGILR